MNLTIIYMVAGLSSRFGGKIKPLTEVGTNNETLIEISANQAIRAGFNKIIFIVGEHTEKPFKEKFGDKGLIYIGKGYVKMGSYTSLSNKIWLDVIKSHVILIAKK